MESKDWNDGDEQEDKGGGIYPSTTCPHLFINVPQSSFCSERLLKLLDHTSLPPPPSFPPDTVNAPPSQLQEAMRNHCEVCSSDKENWVCLTCFTTRCSRYVNGDMSSHFYETLHLDEPHCLALSLSDLSVWCYICESYVKHDVLIPLLFEAEHEKFCGSTSLDSNYMTMQNKLKDKLSGRRRIYNVGLAYPFTSMKESHTCRTPGISCLERPKRVSDPEVHLENVGLTVKVKPISPTPENRRAPLELLQLGHSTRYINAVMATSASASSTLSSEESIMNSRKAFTDKGDLFVDDDTADVAREAVALIVELTRSVMKGIIRSGFALLRPPGHHASSDDNGGYCWFNNVAIAARVAQTEFGVNRVMILDWDIHHGNGTQDIFYEDPSVLTISIHKQYGIRNGEEVCYGSDGNMDRIGGGAGRGYNINIPLGGEPCIDADYDYVFSNIIDPIARDFKPDLIIVASGFDACISDQLLPVGGYMLTPRFYGDMTSRLSQLASEGRVVLCLEGGYDIMGIATCTQYIMESLLDNDPVDAFYIPPSTSSSPSPSLRNTSPTFPSTYSGSPNSNTIAVVDNVKKLLSEHWGCFGKGA